MLIVPAPWRRPKWRPSLPLTLFWLAVTLGVWFLGRSEQADHDAAAATEPPLLMFPDPTDAARSCIVENGKTICLTVIVD